MRYEKEIDTPKGVKNVIAILNRARERGMLASGVKINHVTVRGMVAQEELTP